MNSRRTVSLRYGIPAAAFALLTVIGVSWQPAQAASTCRFIVAGSEERSESRARRLVLENLQSNARDQLSTKAVIPSGSPRTLCTGRRVDPDRPDVEVFGCVAGAFFCAINVPPPIDPDPSPPGRTAPDIVNPKVNPPDRAIPRGPASKPFPSPVR